MILTNQLIYLVNIKTMTKIFFQIMCASQKVRTLIAGTMQGPLQWSLACGRNLKLHKFQIWNLE